MTRQVLPAGKKCLAKRDMQQISHEVRASLNVIIGFSELMLDEVPGKINPEQRRCLDDILNSSRRLLALFDGHRVAGKSRKTGIKGNDLGQENTRRG